MAPDIELVPDPGGGGGVTVLRDGHPQSHVDLSDPEHLAFEYVQHFACVLDTLPAGRLAVTHIGGAGLTLARYVEAVRPGSPQIVLEPDARLTETVRRELPLHRRHRIRVRPVDGRTGVATLRDGSADVVVLDAYAEGRVPPELTTVEFLGEVARVLAPGGVALLNLADDPGLRFVRRVASALRTGVAYSSLSLVATHEILKGRRFGNAVLVAQTPVPDGGTGLDLCRLHRRIAASPFPTGLRTGAELDRLLAGVRPSTVEDPAASPRPPEPDGWGRR